MVGDFVAELNPAVRRQEWSTGRVVNTFPGADGLVRAVDIQLPTGIYRRGVRQLCLLEPISTGQSQGADPVSGDDVSAKRVATATEAA